MFVIRLLHYKAGAADPWGTINGVYNSYMKTCIRCRENKRLENFATHPTAKDGRRNQCNPCRYKMALERDPNYRNKQKGWNLGRYGITVSEYDQMLKEQNNLCKICKQDFIKTPHVDHCHETKKIRGLLCSNCNTMLGLAKDSPQILERAIRYLELSRN